MEPIGRKRKRTRFSDSFMLNQATYQDYIQQMEEIALNVFRYENLPDTVDERFMELQLLTRGYCVYFRDEIIGDLCLPCTIGGMLNVYNIPIDREAFATNGYHRHLTMADSVLIFNNYLHSPGMLTIELFAQRLTNIQRSIDVNCSNQKFPFLITTTDSQKLSVVNAFEQVDGNQPVIIADKNYDPDSIKPYDLAVPFVADRLHVELRNTWNDFLTWCGIENANQEKKERMTSQEIGANYGNVEVQRDVRLKARRDALKEVNRMFGTNIEVYYNSNLRTMLNENNLLEKGEEIDGVLYNNGQNDNRRIDPGDGRLVNGQD